MIPTFRNAILMINDGEAEKWVNTGNYKWHKNEWVDDNLLHQLQRMFAYLSISDRKAYYPSKFAFSVKDWDNNPLDAGIQ